MSHKRRREGSHIRIDQDTTLAVTTCYCGLKYAIPNSLYLETRENPNMGVWCPVGHKWVYKASRFKQLQADLQRAQKELSAEQASHDQTKAELRDKEGLLTRIMQRIRRGRN